MAEFIDFEDVIHLNEIYAQKETDNASRNSQEPLSELLDKMCETLDVDRIELSAGNFDKQANEVIPSAQLDEFEEILNETYVSDDNAHKIETIENNQIAQLDRKYTSVMSYHCSLFGFDIIEDIVENTAIRDETGNELTGKVDDVKMDLSPTTIGLSEFHKIYNETCCANDNLDKIQKNAISSDHAENTASLFANLSENSIEIIENQYDDTIINLDEIENIFDEENGDNFNGSKEPTSNDSKMGEKVNGNAAKPCPDDDLNIVDLKTNTNTSESIIECKGEYEHIDHGTKPNDVITAIKKDLEDRERLHAFQTVNLDVTMDDIISISSTECDDGYNSSDFEFISESEAKNGGILVNNTNKALHPLNTIRQTNFDSNPDYIKYHKNRYKRCSAENVKADRESHVIPEGESFLDLFRGTHYPMLDGYSSNKHALPAKSTSFNTDGFGFDLPANVEDNAEFKNEAVKTAKKIRFLYPDENRKRRRL